MKFFEKLIFILFATLFVATISFSQETVFVKNPKAPSGETGPAFAFSSRKEVESFLKNPNEYIAKNWARNVQLNMKKFPKPDSLAVGDTVDMDVDGEKISFVAGDSLNSQWVMNIAAVLQKAKQKDAPINITIKKGPEVSRFMHVVVSLVALILAATIIGSLILLYVLAFKKNKKGEEKKEKECETTDAKAPATTEPLKEELANTDEITNEDTIYPPILEAEKIPDFNTGSVSEVRVATADAIQNIYHQPFEIVGDVIRGLVDGTMIVWDAFGNRTVTTFFMEPGFRAVIRFTESGKVIVVYCKWSCFNPLVSARDAEFRGKFYPMADNTVEDIPTMPEQEADEMSWTIFPDKEMKAGETELVNIKQQVDSEKTETIEPAKEEKSLNGYSNGLEIILTELSVGSGPARMTMKGTIPVTQGTKEVLMEIIKAGK